MLFTWFMLAGFIFLLTPHKLTKTCQSTFDRVFSWPLSIGRNISLSVRTQQPFANVVSRREYKALQNHLANIIGQRDHAYQEIKKLSGLRKRLPLEGAKLALAYIVRASHGPSNKLRINIGENDGLAEGQFVIADNSIIGTICDVSSRTAWVKLFTDSTSKIAVKIAKLDIDRMMQGDGSNSAKIQQLQIDHKVNTGNIIYARQKAGFLDAPMIIGTVAECKRDDENPALWDVTVKPVCDIERLNSVVVIIMNPQE